MSDTISQASLNTINSEVRYTYISKVKLSSIASEVVHVEPSSTYSLEVVKIELVYMYE